MQYKSDAELHFNNICSQFERENDKHSCVSLLSDVDIEADEICSQTLIDRCFISRSSWAHKYTVKVNDKCELTTADKRVAYVFLWRTNVRPQQQTRE